MHIANIHKNKELDEKRTRKEFLLVRKECNEGSKHSIVNSIFPIYDIIKLYQSVYLCRQLDNNKNGGYVMEEI